MTESNQPHGLLMRSLDWIDEHVPQILFWPGLLIVAVVYAVIQPFLWCLTPHARWRRDSGS